MKKETIVYEYKACGECSNADMKNGMGYCVKAKRRIPYLWGEIPKWCPLEDKDGARKQQ